VALRLGVFYGLAGTMGVSLIQFASSVIIARILAPDIIGIFVVSLAVTSLLQALRDLGASQYLIQEKNLTDEKIRSVFGASLVVGVMVAAALFFGRGYLADFYHKPEMSAVLAWLSVTFLLLPIGQPAMGMMRRERHFGKLTLCYLSGTLLGAITSIYFAMAGQGAMSMAYGAVASAVTTSIVALTLWPEHLFMTPSLSEWRTVGKFGVFVSGVSIINRAGSAAPELIMGSLLNFTSAAFFNRGVAFTRLFDRLFVGSVQTVLGPEFAAVKRSGAEITRLVLSASAAYAVIGWPCFVFLFWHAQTIVEFVYGAKWLGVVPALQALAIAQAILLLKSVANPIYESEGAMKLLFRNELIVQLVSIIAIAIAASFGFYYVIWAQVPLAVLAVVVHWRVISRAAKISIGQYLLAMKTPLSVTAMFAMVLVVLSNLDVHLLPDIASKIRLFIEALAMAIVYVALLAVHKDAFFGKLLALRRKTSHASE
jgi:O-antigen/teichoic acid export membrane protein